MAESNESFYRKTRQLIKDWIESKAGKDHRWAEYVLLVPDMFNLLWGLSTDKEVPPDERAKLLVCIAYFISPIDLIPEAFLGPIGFLDDIAVAAWVLNGLINSTNAEIVQRHWAGDGDILEWIRKILMAADQMIGKGMWRRVRGMFPR
jgi:uncharacterized membrane protein YkvA (DUF1232 family)